MSVTEKKPQISASGDCPPCPGRPVLERIEARAAELGAGLVIRRALPSRQRRIVGAWCFLDHAGPADHWRRAGRGVGRQHQKMGRRACWEGVCQGGLIWEGG